MKKLLLFLAAALLGLLLVKLKLPIPYMLGGIIAAAAAKAFVDENTDWPVKWRMVALCVAGYGIGRNFTPAALVQLQQQLVGVFGATFIALLCCVFIAWWTYKHTFANLISCVMGITPGGLTQMMLMSEDDPRVDANIVVVMQTVRMFAVVFSVPFLVVHFLGAEVMSTEQAAATGAMGLHWLILFPLAFAGAFLATKLHVPTPTLLGPILITSIASCTIGAMQAVPDWLMLIAQANIGLYMGTRLDKKRLLQTKKLLPYIIGGSFTMVAVSVGVAYLLAQYYHFSPVAAFLAMAPGGIAEMCLAGMSMGVDVSIILSYQFVRLIIINLIVPFVIKWYFNADYKG